MKCRLYSIYMITPVFNVMFIEVKFQYLKFCANIPCVFV